MVIQTYEPAATGLIDPTTELIPLADGFQFTEGPIWDSAQRRLIFSDIPANTMYSYTSAEGIQTYRKPSNFSNGLTIDHHGCLLACEHHTRRITREDTNGMVAVLASHYQGKRLNSPNDLIVAGDGSIIFTDPHYGLQAGLGGPADQELPFRGVYRLAPDATEPTLLVDDFDAPNGLALSLDERTLYIDDSIHQHIRAFQVNNDWSLTGGDILTELRNDDEAGVPDGLKIDAKGNIFCTGPGGIWIINQAGAVLAKIPVPEVAANLNWGEADRRTLFITASTRIYKIQCLVHGPYMST